ncbi:hypothetical protein [Peribacillus huizhouensis]|uniref:Exosporium protein D n=1 Tax=Peribacillus huizhouensis TaxID=1501239 RepID=A0ABR6CMN3_9BACI|nr:hypothetical protein [Peribacillus huizhouensis]MBA9026269.1 hypothetical protein [Peribacillus huizhouensis]
MVYINRYYSGDYYEDFYSKKSGNKKDHCKKDDRKDRNKKEEEKEIEVSLKQQCTVQNHNFTTGDIPVPANATNLVIFEDFTKNHNKTFLALTAGNNAGVQVTITTREKKHKKDCCHRPITETIPAGGTRVFQVEDFKRLTVSNPTNNATTLRATIQKSFCICCKADQDKKHHEHDEHHHHDCDCD